MMMLFADAVEKMGTSGAQVVLAIVVGGLVIAVVWLALYIRKTLTEHKNELLTLSNSHMQKCKECAVKVELTAAMAELAKERHDRRIEGQTFLKEVIETAHTMSKAVDSNTQSQGQLAELIKRWQEI